MFDVQIRVISEFFFVTLFLYFLLNLFREIFAITKKSVISNFENWIFPILAKIQNSENSVFRRALAYTRVGTVINKLSLQYLKESFILHSVPRIVALITTSANTGAHVHLGRFLCS